MPENNWVTLYEMLKTVTANKRSDTLVCSLWIVYFKNTFWLPTERGENSSTTMRICSLQSHFLYHARLQRGSCFYLIIVPVSLYIIYIFFFSFSSSSLRFYFSTFWVGGLALDKFHVWLVLLWLTTDHHNPRTYRRLPGDGCEHAEELRTFFWLSDMSFHHRMKCQIPVDKPRPQVRWRLPSVTFRTESLWITTVLCQIPHAVPSPCGSRRTRAVVCPWRLKAAVVSLLCPPCTYRTMALCTADTIWLGFHGQREINAPQWTLQS